MIILYNDEKRSYYYHHAGIIYSYAKVTYPDHSKSGITTVLDGYTIMHGLPVIIKHFQPVEKRKDSRTIMLLSHTFNCIDIISSMADRYGAVPCKDFLNLLKRIEYLQKRAIWLDMNNNLSLDTMKIMDEELSECYDKLLYLYICSPDIENLVDYTPEWKEEYKDEISDEFLSLWGEVYLFKNVITTSIMAKRQKRKPPYNTPSWVDKMVYKAEHELDKIF